MPPLPPLHTARSGLFTAARHATTTRNARNFVIAPGRPLYPSGKPAPKPRSGRKDTLGVRHSSQLDTSGSESAEVSSGINLIPTTHNSRSAFASPPVVPRETPPSQPPNMPFTSARQHLSIGITPVRQPSIPSGSLLAKVRPCCPGRTLAQPFNSALAWSVARNVVPWLRSELDPRPEGRRCYRRTTTLGGWPCLRSRELHTSSSLCETSR